MFSEELEMLIEAAIADGEITEKERSILHKRAQAEGVDPDELDMILNARMTKQESENYSNKLINLVQEVRSQEYKGNIFKKASEKRAEAVSRVIDEFPIPNKKEDLLDLLGFLKSQGNKNLLASGDEEWAISKAYKRKYDECVNQAKAKYPTDIAFTQFYEKDSILKGLGGLFGKKF